MFWTPAKPRPLSDRLVMGLWRWALWFNRTLYYYALVLRSSWTRRTA